VIGTTVGAIAAGTVRMRRATKGGGCMVVLEHADDDGNLWWSEYLHLSAFAVDPGERVEAGQAIGLSGNTGTASKGPHLHLQIRVSGAWLAVHRLGSAQTFRTGKGLIYVDPLAIGLVSPPATLTGWEVLDGMRALGAAKPSPVRVKAWCRWQGTQAATELIVAGLLAAAFFGWIRLPR
jgi:murein DD-endopeptidase MepM/ murein hydrolase activator NlpD